MLKQSVFPLFHSSLGFWTPAKASDSLRMLKSACENTTGSHFGDSDVTWLEGRTAHALGLRHCKQIIQNEILIRNMKLFCFIFAQSSVTHEFTFWNPKFNLLRVLNNDVWMSKKKWVNLNASFLGDSNICFAKTAEMCSDETVTTFLALSQLRN